MPANIISSSPDVLSPEVKALLAKAGVTRETLEDTVPRVTRFVQAATINPRIRARLAAHGLTQDQVDRASSLLMRLMRLPKQAEPTPLDATARLAMNVLDEADEDLFRLIRGAWQFRFPEQYAFVTDKLQPSTGFGAVLGVEMLLNNLDELDEGPSRVSTRDKDHEALAYLANRGVNKAKRSQLRMFVEQAKSLKPLAIPPTDAWLIERLETLIELRQWYLEWADVARVAIKRRDMLISLGLASRRQSASESQQDKAPAIVAEGSETDDD